MKVIFEVDNTRIDYVRDDQLEKNLCFHLIAMEIPLVVNENELQLGGRRQIIIRKLPRMFAMVPKLSTRIFLSKGMYEGDGSMLVKLLVEKFRNLISWLSWKILTAVTKYWSRTCIQIVNILPLFVGLSNKQGSSEYIMDRIKY